MAETDATGPGGAAARPGGAAAQPGGAEACGARCTGCGAGAAVAQGAAVAARPCAEGPGPKPAARPASACPLVEGRVDDWIRCCTARFLPIARQTAGDDATARDALQDSWIAVWRGIDGYRGRPPACAWVWTIVRRMAARGKARRRREVAADGHCARAPAPAGADPENDADRRRLRRLLLDGISGLSPEDRRIIRLRDLDGLPPEQVAARLRLSRTAVSSRLHRAHARLRRRLRRLGLKPRAVRSGSGRSLSGTS